MGSPLFKAILRALNVPANLPHLSRAAEIADLPKHLEVDVETVSDQYVLATMGPTPPTGPAVGWPWFKTGSDGRPIGVFIQTGPELLPATEEDPALVRSSPGGMIMRMGTASFTVPSGTVPGTLTLATVVDFTDVFATKPLAFVTPHLTAEFGSMAYSGGFVFGSNVTFTPGDYALSVGVYYRPAAFNTTADVPISFDWLLIGEGA